MCATRKPPEALEPEGRLTRRGAIRNLAASVTIAVATGICKTLGAREPVRQTNADEIGPYGPRVLPPSIRSRFVNNGNGIVMHVLESGFETSGRPLVVLLHGFPELAYSWRKVMPSLAAAGFYVLAPDLRGYGLTSGWNVSYDDDIRPFFTLNQVRDILGLVSAFGYRSVAGIAGHDFGAPLAAWCSLVRPDVFHSVVIMSGPFGGPPSLPFNTAGTLAPSGPVSGPATDIDADLAKLTPPRMHYQRYYTTRGANSDMWHARQGLHAFLRAYYYMKSADWPGNHPFPLKSWTASELAKMPHYYIMERNKGMAENVAPEMPSLAQISACKWLTENELNVYTAEYTRTGFQGGLNGYRVGRDPRNATELRMFSGRTIDVPSLFIAGNKDWNVYQRPGALDKMENAVCRDLRGVHIVAGAGHWVQQEQADEVNRLMLGFLKS